MKGRYYIWISLALIVLYFIINLLIINEKLIPFAIGVTTVYTVLSSFISYLILNDDDRYTEEWFPDDKVFPKYIWPYILGGPIVWLNIIYKSINYIGDRYLSTGKYKNKLK